MNNPALRLAGDSPKALPRKLNFTVSALEKLTCPAGRGRILVYDTKTPGLAFRVTEKGAKGFYLYRKVHGRPLKMKLGGFPDISIEQARTLAAKATGKIADGKDPLAERKAIRQSDTLGELYKRWKEEHAKLRLRPRTIETDESRFDTCFEDWKGRKIGAIRPADVKAKHVQLGKSKGKVTANRAIQLLRRLLNFARIEPNPAGKGAVEFFDERSRDRFLQPDELPRFFQALEDEPNTTIRDFLYLCLWTGARRSNVESMRWAELDLEGGIWTIPAEKAKAKEPIRIPLTAPAMKILQERQQKQQEAEALAVQQKKRKPEEPPCPWVFRSHRVRSKTGHLVEAKGAWKQVLKRAGINDLRMHDLRRSLGSWAAATGASLPIIGKALGHHDPKATAIYARLQLDPVRQAVDKAAAAMLGAVEAAKAKKKAKPQQQGDGAGTSGGGETTQSG